MSKINLIAAAAICALTSSVASAGSGVVDTATLGQTGSTNTYTGGTTIRSGTLLLAGAPGVANGGGSVVSGSGAVTTISTGTLSPTNAPGVANGGVVFGGLTSGAVAYGYGVDASNTDTQGGAISALQSNLASTTDSLQAAIGTQSNAISALQSNLASTTDSLQTSIGTQGNAITALQSNLASTTDSLQTSISTQGSAITALQSNFTRTLGSLQTTLGTQGNAISALQSNLATQGADLTALQTQANGLATEFTKMTARLNADQKETNQGIAMSFAMAGVANLQQDETVAFTANWGAFHGQNGVAGGVAYRLASHVSIDGGLAAPLTGGPVAGRAGIRFAW